MTIAKVKVTVSFFAEVDTADYLDEDWEAGQDGEEEEESDRPELSLSEAVAKVQEHLRDGAVDVGEALGNSDEIDDVKVELV